MQICTGKLFRFSTLLLAMSQSTIATSADDDIISFDRLTGTSYDTLVVAQVGQLEITAKEFLLSYEYGPAFVKRMPKSRERFLQFMIYEKLLALDGYTRGVDTTPLVSQTVADIEGDLATEELYKRDVLSKVVVSDTEIETAVVRERETLTLQWLYAGSFPEIRQMQRSLEHGIPFDSLFAKQLVDSVPVDERSMQITRFRLEGKNGVLSAVTDTLQSGRYSAPIGVSDGWYIVRLANVSTNPILTESEYHRLTHSVKRALYKRKADTLSDRYVQELMLEHAPVIRRRSFDLLRAYLARRYFPPGEITDWELTKKLMGEFGPIDSVRIADHKDEELVALQNQDDLRIADFSAWYLTRKSSINLAASSLQTFSAVLENLIWRMVRDRLLFERATALGLRHLTTVQTQKKWWLDKSTSSYAKNELEAGIDITEPALRQYYNAHKNDYRNSNGEPQSFETIKQRVTSDAFAAERQKRLLHKILELKKHYRVVVNDTVLAQVPIDTPSDPNPIEVYVAKTGGAFPRPAFPTIGYDWQTWY